jgi:hypothetical protein
MDDARHFSNLEEFINIEGDPEKAVVFSEKA